MKEELKLTKRKLILSVDVEDIIRKEVVPIGNGAHVICPKEHIGKIVYIVVVCKKRPAPTARSCREKQSGSKGRTRPYVHLGPTFNPHARWPSFTSEEPSHQRAKQDETQADRHDPHRKANFPENGYQLASFRRCS